MIKNLKAGDRVIVRTNDIGSIYALGTNIAYSRILIIEMVGPNKYYFLLENSGNRRFRKEDIINWTNVPMEWCKDIEKYVGAPYTCIHERYDVFIKKIL